MGIKRKPGKMVLVLLALIMTLSTAACSSGGGDKNNESKANNGKAANATNTAATTEPTKAPASADEPGWKSDTSPITFDWYLNFAWFPNKWGVDPTSKYITKKTGVDINFIVPAGNENEKLNTLIASGKLPDFITLGWYEDAVKKINAALNGDFDKLKEELTGSVQQYSIESFKKKFIKFLEKLM